ncbi:PREDICTED: probable disease resistance protein RPP1 [Camelina sativa]|uniref:ADP-ribosyl cyclase/cyclic ADP-ribose hydrolase n=1 Tax=Camelina sativa TaxID=90675 RepID=A0ABM1RD18_CAMSA|nr:PREDICTED: probable disease resistance protein RPP1 [Camelina sativa]
MISNSSSSLHRTWLHNVFPSFHGADVQKSFLSHIWKEFRRKGIEPYIHDDTVRGEVIGPELQKTIQGSKIALVLLSKRYASSPWCLDELTEIMKCKKNLGQTVMAIFYEVDPTDVKKQAGDFGKVFRQTCEGKTTEVIGEWSQALTEVATIAGYHSINWATEAEMIEDIATDVSNKLINSTPSRDIDDFVGMEAHMEKLKQLLCLESDEVRMIGIWGPPGIGKSTIVRCLFNQLFESNNKFQQSVFLDNVRATYAIPFCSGHYAAKMDNLQQNFMSQITNHKNIQSPHLKAQEDKVKDKKVLVVLDDVDQSLHLEAIAKETGWFGPGSRIIVTTQDPNLLKAHGINDIYKVGFPEEKELKEIFCMYAFGQRFPKDGFENLVWEIIHLAGKLPLALRVIGSYLRGMCMQQWQKALPTLRSRLDGKIESVLMFSYDALCEEHKYLFLFLTSLFPYGKIEKIEDFLPKKTFSNFRQGIEVLVEKSLISIVFGSLEIDSLLIQLGREIVRRKYGSKPSIRKPGKRQFLHDERDICEVLSDDTAGSSNVIGIKLTLSSMTEDEEFYISERAFERMSNLQFLTIGGDCSRLHFPPSLNSISRNLISLNWDQYPMTCLPSNFYPQSLISLTMTGSKLEKLWDKNKKLKNLKIMNLSSKSLKELPDLSTATNLEDLRLGGCSSLVKLTDLSAVTNLEILILDDCSSLVELPSLENATNLKTLSLKSCSSLVELPSSIGKAINLKDLTLDGCSNLIELPSSVGSLDELLMLFMNGCSKLKVLPININMKSLTELHLRNCSVLETFPEISTNIKKLHLTRTAIEEVPLGVRSWSRLEELHMSYCENLKDSPHALDSITDLHLTDTSIKELGPWVEGFSRLRRLLLNGSQKLESLPQLPDSLLFLDAENCVSLERLDCSFRNPEMSLNFYKCFKLNQEARDVILQASNRPVAVLPGGEVPAYFSHRATGSSVTVKLDERSLDKSLRFKACIMLVEKVHNAPPYSSYSMYVSFKVMDKQNGLIVPCPPGHLHIPCAATFIGHLYTFDLEVDVTSNELCFELTVYSNEWEVKECGVLQLS